MASVMFMQLGKRATTRLFAFALLLGFVALFVRPSKSVVLPPPFIVVSSIKSLLSDETWKF
jgi:hypothetical protein